MTMSLARSRPWRRVAHRQAGTGTLRGLLTVCALVGSLLSVLPVAPAQAAEPDFGQNVVVFDPSMSDAAIQAKLDAAYAVQKDNEFGTQRYAFLFKPGQYSVDANLGYYTSVAGLGASPDDVTIDGAVRVEGRSDALTNFWRSAENLSITPTGGTNRWAVSQAAPLRRVHVRGALDLHTADYAYASGGYIADSKVDGAVDATTQQQYYTRDSEIGSWTGSVWNEVFSGVSGAPPQSFPNPQMTTLAATPVSREKPYLTVDGSGKYSVFVPSARSSSSGTTWSSGTTPGTSIALSNFYIAKPADSAATINAQLAAGRHLLLTPGTYQLAQPLNVSRAGTVVLGLGFPTLVPTTGNSTLQVSDVDGVRVAGLLIDAGATNSANLVRIGASSKTSVRHTSNPTSVQDVFFRIGGARAGRAANSLLVNSNDVIIDHIWAWRADHGAGAGWTSNPAATGVTVNGDRVTALGLFAEHYQKHQVIWNGQNGRTVFYQSELPYDPPSQAAWMSSATGKGYASYKVGPSVTSHEAWGLGVYSYFNQGQPLHADRAVEVPDRSSVALHDIVSVFLAGSGGIDHVVNNTGAAVAAAGETAYVVDYAAGTPTRSSGKKGVAAITSSGDAAKLSALGSGWYYNWSTNGAKAGNAEYVPMAWNALPSETVNTLADGAKNGNYSALLGFNEPDLPDQANMTVEQALNAWPALQSTGLRLGSPAPANYWSGWLDDFMAGARARGYRVDFIALHMYPDWTNPGALEEVRGVLADAWNKWHKPIWLTEIGTVDTSTWKPMYGTPTHAKADGLIQKLIPLLENLPYLERYAWFADDCATNASCQYSTLYGADGKLTSHGSAYAAAGPPGPSGRFRMVNKAQPTLTVHATGESYEGGSALNAAVTPTSWGWDQQRWNVTPADGAYYTVTNVGSPGLRLTTSTDPYPSGGGNYRIKVAAATGSDDQLWRLEKTEDGYYRLISKARGTALQSTFDVYNGSAEARQLAGTSASFVNDQQSWAFVPG
ncbi:glycosyl hydrolase [uncultured Streptomyces sp.]|uniref:glycosyl hydrolase n=1 Tax=uncultured Streptomyces sp. TaxID=174707 RepID=UPI002625EB31|nr:glycosyl hydrolase [uncultured Streptomyces sp.]